MNNNNLIDLITHGDCVELRLQRPPVNALTTPLMAALSSQLSLAAEQGARGVVISGREGLFSAGVDVPELISADRETVTSFWTEFFSCLRSLATSSVPVVAAIGGHAPAGGAVIALHCDYRVMAKGDWKIGLNEAQIGLPVPPSVFAALEWAVGSRKAELMASSGQVVAPETALEIGLVDKLTEPAELLEECLRHLQGLLELPPVAMNESRLTAKRELLARLGEPAECARLATAAWFSPEAQACLQELVARLGK